MISLDIKAVGLKQVERYLRDLDRNQIPKIMAKALNDVGFSVRRSFQKELEDNTEGGVTPYIRSSVWVDQARPDRLGIRVWPRYLGGKSGVDPERVINAQFYGGERNEKRSERALRLAGILPPGYYTVIPRNPYPGSHDGRGNLKGSFIVRLLSYFQAFGEQGYRANMTAKNKAKLAGRTKVKAENGREYTNIGGVAFFVSYGPLRSGRTNHLEPGIWAKSGIQGGILKPVVIFVRKPNYKPGKYDLDRITKAANVQDRFERSVRREVRKSLGV